MNSTKRTLVILAGITALAASSNATIQFTGLSSYDTPIPGVNGEVQVSDTFLQSGIGGVATNSVYSQTFKVQSTAGGIVSADVDDVDGGVSLGSFKLDLTVNGTTAYTSTKTEGAGGISVLSTSGSTALSLAAGTWYDVTYTATYTGTDPINSFAYANAFYVFFHETGATPPPPVPEPASLATVGLGLIGLVARRRRGVK